MSDSIDEVETKKPTVRCYETTFQRAEKSASKIESAINSILANGKFLGASQIENPSTGRLYYSVMLDESKPCDTKAMVLREYQPETMQEKINNFISVSGYRQQTLSVSAKSNIVTKTIFARR